MQIVFMVLLFLTLPIVFKTILMMVFSALAMPLSIILTIYLLWKWL
jgi:hypothetical protein